MEVRRYGEWAGNPKGVAEDPNHCVAGLWKIYKEKKWHYCLIEHQCTHKRGYGSDGLYCKVHAKKFEGK